MDAYRFEFRDDLAVLSTFAVTLDGDLEALDMARVIAKQFDVEVLCGDRSVAYVKRGDAPSTVQDAQAG